jgi:hypothetical protein
MDRKDTDRWMHWVKQPDTSELCLELLGDECELNNLVRCSSCGRNFFSVPLKYFQKDIGFICKKCYVEGSRCCKPGCNMPAAHMTGGLCRVHYIDEPINWHELAREREFSRSYTRIETIDCPKLDEMGTEEFRRLLKERWAEKGWHSCGHKERQAAFWAEKKEVKNEMDT